MMTRIFITGGTGFIGQAVVQCLQGNLDYDIYILSRREHANLANCHFVLGDVAYVDSYRQALEEIRPQILLHLAWDVAAQDYSSSHQNYLWLQWTLDLAKVFLQVGGRKIVASGTCFEYDLSATQVLKEADACLPATCYGQCKLETYRGLRSLCDEFGAKMVWGRIFYPYGAEEEPRKLIRFVLDTWQREQIFYCKTPDNIVDYIYIQDVARMFVLFITHPTANGIYNVCTGKGQRIFDALQYVLSILHLPSSFLQAEPVKQSSKIVGDVQKLQSIGYISQYNFQQGMADYFKHRIGGIQDDMPFVRV